MDIELLATDRLRMDGIEYRCATGKSGISSNKREGDNCTPVGRFPLRQLYWRPDVFKQAPETGLETIRLEPEMGWCDAPKDERYNHPVLLPYPASHEKLWRADHVYDLILVVGYNDEPVMPGAGSAIFIHLARENYEGTEGCVALNRADLLEVLSKLRPDSWLYVPPEIATKS